MWFGIIDATIKLSPFSSLFTAFLAGILYTSFFTNPIAVSVFIVMGHNKVNPFLVAGIGAFGALIGDELLYRLFRGNPKKTRGYTQKIKKSMLHKLALHRPFQWLLGIIGALIILSPFPDELGIALMSEAQVRPRNFALLSYILNGIGILIIVWFGVFTTRAL